MHPPQDRVSRLGAIVTVVLDFVARFLGYTVGSDGAYISLRTRTLTRRELGGTRVALAGCQPD